MNIVQINATYKIGSTGKIAADLNEVITHYGHKGYVVCGYHNAEQNPDVYYTSKSNPDIQMKKNILVSRITGQMGYRYKSVTKNAIRWIDEKNPDIIHLHNIHGDWIHLETLFNYIKKKKIPVVWTLHDCWAFTGRCSYFELCGCDKWKTQCHNCPNRKVYPITYFFDHSSQMYGDKKKWFTSIENMTIVTPSQWLADYVKQSYLGKYPVKVIHNGINTDIFSPQSKKSRYYDKLDDKRIILGVASSWSARKGLDDFLKLDSMIDHNEFQIVLVGLNERQFKSMPKTIMGIKRTNNQQELAELYSGADVFVNPTYQDNYPTTNLEAKCCGTPCITYNTGGSPESVSEPSDIVEQGDIKSLLNRIIQVCGYDSHMTTSDKIREFDKTERFIQYIRLYESIV